MNARIFFLCVAVSAIAIPSAGALNFGVADDADKILRDENGNVVLDVYGLPAPNLQAYLPTNFGCENGSHLTSFPYPNDPTVTVSVDILCPDPNQISLDSLTDCPGTSWSHWQGPAAQAWHYTFDTANPFGFSSATVASGWDASNKEWESHTSPLTNVYDGYTVATVSATSGTYDSYILAEWRPLGGQLRNAVGVQWAWASGGKIIHTDAAYNTNYAFANGAVANKYDFQSISAHEMGHGFGMGHSDTSTASRCLTVYPYATLNSAHGRTLGDGDILGIQARY
jgi:hypothetical protein